MKLAVTKFAPVLVVPSEPTPSGHLPLSPLDRLPAMRCLVPMIHVFRYGQESAKVIREGLAKALVPYYPVAGRIVVDPNNGELHVACTGEGVWFVEAAANCTLEDVGYLDRRPLAIPTELLIPSLPLGIEESELSFLMQVTEFKCGGFTVGFVASHIMFDALGLGQFIQAISEMARGLAQPSIKPVWCRESIPAPALQTEDAPTADTTKSSTPLLLEHYAVDLSLDVVNELKTQFMHEMGQTCSVFDVVAAKIWQIRTRVIRMKSDEVVTLNYPANLREHMSNVLPPGEGYYGNCFCDIMVEATSERIANGPFSDIVKLIRDAKERFSPGTSICFRGDRIIRYSKLCLSDLRRVGFFEADYGWGKPDRVVPMMNHPIGLCNIVNSPGSKRSVRLLTQCVVKEDLEAFKEEMSKLA